MRLPARLTAPLLAVALAGGFAAQLTLGAASAADLMVSAAPLQTWVAEADVPLRPDTCTTEFASPAEATPEGSASCAQPSEAETEGALADPTSTTVDPAQTVEASPDAQPDVKLDLPADAAPSAGEQPDPTGRAPVTAEPTPVAIDETVEPPPPYADGPATP